MDYPFSNLTQRQLNIIIKNNSGCYLFYGDDKYGQDLAIEHIAENIFGQTLEIIKKSFSESYIEIIGENSKSISIKSIHSLNKKIWQKTNLNHRIIVIQGADNMSKDSANALLKNIEDLPDNTIFILVCKQTQAVLPTIISRSQLINFKYPDIDDAAIYLSKKMNIDLVKGKEALEMSHGNYIKAINILSHKQEQEYNNLKDRINLFLNGSITEQFIVASEIYLQKNAYDFLEELIYTLKDQSTILNQVEILENILSSIKELNSNINSRLVLENLALQNTEI